MFFAFLVLGSLALCATADFANEALDEHNNYRSIHSASPLSLNSEVNSGAVAYAQELARTNIFQHSSRSSRPGVGENLMTKCTSRGNPSLTARQSVREMYNEVCLYSFSNPRYTYATGHFTQIVWKGSSELGVGVAEGRRGSEKCIYVVFRYKTIGNLTYRGSFQDNVKKGTFNRSFCDNMDVMDEPEAMEGNVSDHQAHASTADQ